jgi:hypothetical protein
VAGIRMPARDRRSPSVWEICTMTRSKRTEIGCFSSTGDPLVPFLEVVVGTLARYRTKATVQVRRAAP